MSIILVGVFLFCTFVAVIYWISSSSKKRGYHSEKFGYETRQKLIQNHERMKLQAREADRQRRLRGFGGWRRR